VTRQPTAVKEIRTGSGLVKSLTADENAARDFPGLLRIEIADHHRKQQGGCITLPVIRRTSSSVRRITDATVPRGFLVR